MTQRWLEKVKKFIGGVTSIASSERFQSFVLFTIILTSLSMGLETIPELVDQFGLLFELLYYLTQAIFAFEITVRLLAFAPRLANFFRTFWNCFDFLIVVVSFIPGIGGFAIIARLLRVLRILRLFSVSDRLRVFAERLEESLDEAFYSALIVCVLGYMFSIVGHYLFLDLDPTHWGDLSSSALSVFYLLLLQDIPKFVTPLLEASQLYILFFIAFYLVFTSLILSVINATIMQSSASREQGGKDGD